MMRVVDLAEGAKAVSRVHRDRKPSIIGRGPNRLHRRIVDAHISRDTEQHHGHRAPLLAALDFPNRCLRIDGIDQPLTHFSRSGHWAVEIGDPAIVGAHHRHG